MLQRRTTAFVARVCQSSVLGRVTTSSPLFKNNLSGSSYNNIVTRSYAKKAVVKKEIPVAWYLPAMDAHPSSFTDYLNTIVFELSKLDRRAQTINLPRHNAKYRYDTMNITQEADKLYKLLLAKDKEKYSHHLPVITKVIEGIDKQYQHTKAALPKQSHVSAMFDAVSIFTEAIQMQSENVKKNNKDDIEKKLLSFIFYLRGRLYMESKINMDQAEQDLLTSIMLGKEESSATPLRPWYPMSALGSLYTRKALRTEELFQNDIYVRKDTKENALDDLKKLAQGIAQRKTIANPQDQEKEFNTVWESEEIKSRREAVEKIFQTKEEAYEGEGVAAESLDGHITIKPYTPNPGLLRFTKDMAHNLLTTARELNDNFTDAMTERGWFYYYYGNLYYPEDYLKRALDDLNRAVEFEERLTKQSPTTWFARAVVHVGRKEYKQAQNDMTKAIQLAPRFPLFYRYRSVCSLPTKTYKQYWTDLEKAFKYEIMSRKDYRREALFARRMIMAAQAAREGREPPGPKKKQVVTVIRKKVKKVVPTESQVEN
jgi:tetratricopeptide (TPR) repeat protein